MAYAKANTPLAKVRALGRVSLSYIFFFFLLLGAEACFGGLPSSIVALALFDLAFLWSPCIDMHQD